MVRWQAPAAPGSTPGPAGTSRLRPTPSAARPPSSDPHPQNLARADPGPPGPPPRPAAGGTPRANPGSHPDPHGQAGCSWTVAAALPGCGQGCRVQGSGFRFGFQGAGCRVRALGSGFKVQGAGCRVWALGSGFRVQGAGCRVQGVCFRVHNPGEVAEVCGLRV